MMGILIIINLVVLHFFADFVLQSDAVAKSKSKSLKALGVHVAIYTTVFLIIGFWFAVVSGVLHAIVDYFTSKWTSRLLAEGRVHDFFVVIGFDQMLHIVSLIVVYTIVGGW